MAKPYAYGKSEAEKETLSLISVHETKMEYPTSHQVKRNKFSTQPMGPSLASHQTMWFSAHGVEKSKTQVPVHQAQDHVWPLRDS